MAVAKIIFVTILVAGSTAQAAYAQSAGHPEFESASIKSWSGEQGSRTGGSPPLRFTPGRVSSMNGGVSVKTIIQAAYSLMGYQLYGGPSWIASDRFELEARSADSAADKTQLALMLRTLLAQRFGFRAHHAQKEMAVYALTIGKKGPKFQELKDGENPPAPPSAEMSNRTSMSGLVNALNTGSGSLFSGLDRPVVDRTGLQGRYFFVFQPWERDQDFKNVLERDSGLKLEPQKAQVDVLIIDQVEKPTSN
jgi:uncharacterized protein (TIGR03435 family)